MPVILEQRRSGSGGQFPAFERGMRTIRLGLVNNMPDSALARTEAQFLDVLDAAAPDFLVRVYFFSLPGIARGDAGQCHLADNHYIDVSGVDAARLDALIVTGTEPKLADLRSEPYWPALAKLFDWIEGDGPPTIFSCLAAHAAVLHFDGIERQKLARKRFGLFDHIAVAPHELTQFLAPTSRVVHSRWNEVTTEALCASGYKILTQAPEAGVDLFVKRKRNQLLFFQGHPEYDPQTLCREYERDIRRFLLAERDTYPEMPEFYFSSMETDLLSHFRERACAERDASLMTEFPIAKHRSAIVDDWHSPAAAIFRPWLLQIARGGTDERMFAHREALPRFAGILQ